VDPLWFQKTGKVLSAILSLERPPFEMDYPLWFGLSFKFNREMGAKLVARLLATQALWVRIQTDISQKKKMGDISEGVATTKYKKNIKATKYTEESIE
jgi:hypothetical protein